MPLYDFRLRFNFAEAYRIHSDSHKIELLELPSGEHITLVSGGIKTPIKDHDNAAIIGKLFASEEQARDAAEESKRALLYWAIEQRLGIDFGDGRPRSVVTKAGLSMFQKHFGCPVRNDVHGIDVYEHVEKMRFVKGEVKPTVGKSPPSLIDTFQREYLHPRHLTENQLLASEVYASSFFDVSARSRFITLVTAVEALLERPKRSDAVEEFVEEFKAKAQLLNIDERTKNSIIGSLEDLKRESITQAGCSLANRLVPNEFFDGQSSSDFFRRCYELRGQILHGGTTRDGSVDMLHLANIAESFVNKLLLAALNSARQ
jgi:hypothetical protein